tara:strand:+ start:31 stop:771 length:741 start_codon:yes stop_codon:yes gene_type:complete
MNHEESSIKINFSLKYGDFKFLKGNRDINEKKVNKIIDSIQIDGIDILKYSPIIVDKELKILDGQHRFYVSKKLGRPVFYVIVEDFGIKGVTRINSNSSNWKVKDFLNSFIDMKFEAYIKINELMKSHRATPLLIGALLHESTAYMKQQKDTFNDGLMKINHLEYTEKLLNVCKDFSFYTRNPYSRSFIEAIQQIRKSKNYDHEEMKKKLKMSGHKIDRLENKKTISRQIEEIFNFKNSNYKTLMK